MSTIITDSKHYTDIANAIRLKTGESANFLPAEMAAAIEAISTGASNAVEFTAPFGRVKGDIDGDGQITEADLILVQNHVAGGTQITDEIELWCADTNFNNALNVLDVNRITTHIGGTRNIFCNAVDAGINPDYYNNWNYHKVDDLNGYFYYDVPVEGMTASSSAFLLSASHSKLFEGVECMEGIARVKAERLPLADTKCLIVWETDGTIWEDANGGFKTVDVDIPLGRMKGDIDGDGLINSTDYDLLFEHTSENAQITDEVNLWCADIKQDSSIDGLDLTRLDKHIKGTANLLCTSANGGVNPDYYNNWTFHRIDNLNGYFYRDIPIKGMNTNSTAVLLVSDYADCFEGVECLENAARIKASRCPVGNCKGNILWKTFEQSKLTVVASAVL